MLIISILLSGVNWILTVTIVWSETSLFLGGWRGYLPWCLISNSITLPPSLFCLFGNVIEKWVNNVNKCNYHNTLAPMHYLAGDFPSIISNSCIYPQSWCYPQYTEAETEAQKAEELCSMPQRWSIQSCELFSGFLIPESILFNYLKSQCFNLSTIDISNLSLLIVARKLFVGEGLPCAVWGI